MVAIMNSLQQRRQILSGADEISTQGLRKLMEVKRLTSDASYVSQLHLHNTQELVALQE
jgi:hypothetical protein